MKKVMYLMRHGETVFNVMKKIQGVCGSPLTEKGINQIKMVREQYFKTIAFDHAYSSPTERTRDTLEIITDQDYKTLVGLREMNFGLYEGMSESLRPKDQSTFYLEFGGESREQVKKRMKNTCTELMKRDGHDSVLVVSHAGACLHFMTNWMDPAEEQKKGFPNGSVFKWLFDVEDEVFTLDEVFRLSE